MAMIFFHSDIDEALVRPTSIGYIGAHAHSDNKKFIGCWQVGSADVIEHADEGNDATSFRLPLWIGDVEKLRTRINNSLWFW